MNSEFNVLTIVAPIFSVILPLCILLSDIKFVDESLLHQHEKSNKKLLPELHVKR